MSHEKDFEFFYIQTGKNIKKYRDLRRYSLQEVADKIGVTKKTIQRYEDGERRIKVDRLEEIANALNVSVGQLTEGAYRFIDAIDDTQNISLPIVGKISCGDGVLAYENIEGYETTPREWLNGGEYFYLRAKGDSMIGARIFEGDLLLIRKQEEVEDGEIAAVLVGEEAMLKKVHRQNGVIILMSTNEKYAPLIYNPEFESNIRIIGKLKKIVINM